MDAVYLGTQIQFTPHTGARLVAYIMTNGVMRIERSPVDTPLRGFLDATQLAEDSCRQGRRGAKHPVRYLPSEKDDAHRGVCLMVPRVAPNNPRLVVYAHTLTFLTPEQSQSPPVEKPNLSYPVPRYALRLTNGHSFNADYTRRFYPNWTPSNVVCECGEDERNTHHMIHTRVLVQSACEALGINPHRYSLPQLFATLNSGGQQR
ncbi:hypothetical protein BJY52DRAFT_1227655 [Lactarius psammicola]|nr:hypothetical protein BJY52DRAFT_1227655 [Lactarius psammicola]